jgi:hypothetical protein
LLHDLNANDSGCEERCSAHESPSVRSNKDSVQMQPAASAGTVKDFKPVTPVCKIIVGESFTLSTRRSLQRGDIFLENVKVVLSFV